MNQLPRGFVHNGESSHVKDEEHKGGPRMRRWRKGKGSQCASVCRCCCTRERVILRLLAYPPAFETFHRFCTNASLSSSYTSIVSLFFLHPSFALFPLFPFPPRVSLFFFSFYFSTIIILSNFSHSKRWRKFVEVTPRKMRRIPCRVKPRGRRTGGLFIRYKVTLFRISVVTLNISIY